MDCPGRRQGAWWQHIPGKAGHGGQGGGPLGQSRPVCHGALPLGKEEEGLLHSGHHLLVGEGLADVGRVKIAHEEPPFPGGGAARRPPLRCFFFRIPHRRAGGKGAAPHGLSPPACPRRTKCTKGGCRRWGKFFRPRAQKGGFHPFTLSK